jgi:hypothetical protein
MAKRLQNVIDDLISLDQSGCIKGRSTFSNIRSTIDIINFVNGKKLPGILNYIDFQTAFDTVNWEFMQKCLSEMNFGAYFKCIIATMYKDKQTCVVNMVLSAFFNPSRGIKTRLPNFSFYLYPNSRTVGQCNTSKSTNKRYINLWKGV